MLERLSADRAAGLGRFSASRRGRAASRRAASRHSTPSDPAPAPQQVPEPPGTGAGTPASGTPLLGTPVPGHALTPGQAGAGDLAAQRSAAPEPVPAPEAPEPLPAEPVPTQAPASPTAPDQAAGSGVPEPAPRRRRRGRHLWAPSAEEQAAASRPDPVPTRAVPSATPFSPAASDRTAAPGSFAFSEQAGTSAENPERYEATMTPAMLAQLHETQGDNGATVMRHTPNLPAMPTGFLIYAGSAPIEVVRDVVIGRDPDARALTGRPQATVLRVPSPAVEISRSHCAVMTTAPGIWSLMDLGSANGTILRHPDGTRDEVPPMLTMALSDGDRIDLGEGVTVEFRLR